MVDNGYRANRNVMYKVLYVKAPPKCPTLYPFWQKRYQSKASGDKRVEDLFYKKHNHEISINVANLFLKQYTQLYYLLLIQCWTKMYNERLYKLNFNLICAFLTWTALRSIVTNPRINTCSRKYSLNFEIQPCSKRTHCEFMKERTSLQELPYIRFCFLRIYFYNI